MVHCVVNPVYMYMYNTASCRLVARRYMHGWYLEHASIGALMVAICTTSNNIL